MEPETRAARGQAAASLVKAVWNAGEHLLGQAVAIAPVEEGTLRGSAQLVIRVNGQAFTESGPAQAVAQALGRAGTPVSVEAEVSFNTVYAARQHEELAWEHRKGGQAKYLSQPLAAAAPRLTAYVQAAATGIGGR